MPRHRPKRVALTVVSPESLAERFGDLGEWPWQKVEIDGVPQSVWVVYGSANDGRPLDLTPGGAAMADTDTPYVITGLLLDPKANVEIGARDLRAIPVGRLLMAAAQSFYVPRVRTPAYKPARIKPGPDGWDHEHFERVAAAYRKALTTHPGGPVRALVAQMGRSEATVHRWLQRCRDMGLLGPTRIERAEARRQRTRR